MRNFIAVRGVLCNYLSFFLLCFNGYRLGCVQKNYFKIFCTVMCWDGLKLGHLNISSRIFQDYKYPAPKFLLQTSQLLVGKVWFLLILSFYIFSLIRTELPGSLLKIIGEQVFMVVTFLNYQNGFGISYNKRGNVRIILTSGRFRVTILALEEQ
jgi:hypothetical protein